MLQEQNNKLKRAKRLERNKIERSKSHEIKNKTHARRPEQFTMSVKEYDIDYYAEHIDAYTDGDDWRTYILYADGRTA
jgi:hypothetical protein